jgi:hypothetical protein
VRDVERLLWQHREEIQRGLAEWLAEEEKMVGGERERGRM